MLDHFPNKEFIELLTELATTPGPSLGEKPRRQVLEKFFSQNNIHTETAAPAPIFRGRRGDWLFKRNQADG